MTFNEAQQEAFNEAQQEAKDFLAGLRAAYRVVALDLSIVDVSLMRVVHSDLWVVATWRDAYWYRSYTPTFLKAAPTNSRSLEGLFGEGDIHFYCALPIDALERLAQVKGL